LWKRTYGTNMLLSYFVLINIGEDLEMKSIIRFW